MKEDVQLLTEFVESGSEAAFETLVNRYVDLVYSTAVRIVHGDQPLAEDVTQSVFIHLASQAPKLKQVTQLAGWLHRHTTFTATKAVRAECRRKKRESIAMEIQSANESTESLWDSLAPDLDHHLNRLRTADRELLLLRFMRQQNLESVGKSLGISPDAAQKRVSRALERLRLSLKRRGLTETTLATMLTHNFVQAAPSGLGTTIAAKSIGAAVAANASGTLLESLATLKLKGALVTFAVAGVLVPVVLQQRVQARLTHQEEVIQHQVARMDELKLARVPSRNDERVEPDTLDQDELSELMKLRGRVARLRQTEQELMMTPDPVDAPSSREEMLAFLETRFALRINQLRTLFDENPHFSVPELQFLEEEDWLFLVGNQSNDDEQGYRKLMSRARTMAESEFGNRHIEPALKAFTAENNGRFPETISDLKPYFKDPVDDAILERWVVTTTDRFTARLRSQLPADDPNVITQRIAIDEALDQRYILGLKDVHLFSDGPAEFWDWSY